MGKVAFVFPGQGAQQPGMGESLYQSIPASKDLLEKLDALRPGLLELCFRGTAEDLAETRNTQPCLFACELAAATALQDAGVSPDMVAGFSLGEVAALCFSGAVSLSDGFALVSRRGELMQADAERADSAMAAVVKLDTKTVEDICSQFSAVYPVNYNCPGQITVACLREQLEPFSAAVKAAGGRALPLKVRGGFHSVFMAEAAKQFGALLEDYPLEVPKLPLYSNFTGERYSGDIRPLLAQQIENPVRWETIVRNMLAEGVDTFFEVGPGNVLSGLIRKIDSTARCFCVATSEELSQAIKEFRAC